MIHPPLSWDPGWTLTDIAASFLGVALPLVTFDDYDVDASGMDQLRPRIQGAWRLDRDRASKRELTHPRGIMRRSLC